MKTFEIRRKIFRHKEFQNLYENWLDIIKNAEFRILMNEANLKVRLVYKDKKEQITWYNNYPHDFDTILRSFPIIFEGSQKLWYLERRLCKQLNKIKVYPRSLDNYSFSGLRKFLYLKNKTEIEVFVNQIKNSLNEKLKKAESNRFKIELRKSFKYIKKQMKRAMDSGIHENEIRKMFNQTIDKNRMISEIKVEKVLLD